MIAEQKNGFLDNIQFELEILPHLTLYKIFGEQHFSFQKAQYESKVDWSGFYTQFKPQHSMRYLTKKWDDGSQMACLIKLFPKDDKARLLRVNHRQLSNPHICGQFKASSIKRHLKNKYPQLCNIEQFKLIQYLGRLNILMSCVDAQQQEIIIPHQLLNDRLFQFQQVASFKKSNDGMLRTISFNKGKGWLKVPSDVQFEPYLLLKQKIWIQ